MISYGFCECGCGQRTAIAKTTRTDRGWIRGKPKRWLPRHHNRRTGPLYMSDPGTGCLNWQGCVSGGGYGQMSASKTAHRHAYEQRHGPIPKGMQVHHRCENKLCCNPDHMELLSVADHARVHSHLPVGPPLRYSDETIAEIRALAQAGWIQRDLAAAYGMDKSYLNKVVLGQKR